MATSTNTHTPTPVSPSASDRAAALLRRSLVWDNHGCMPVGAPYGTAFMPQLQRYRAAGVDVVTLNIGFGDMGPEEHLRTLAALRHWLLARPGEYLLADSPQAIEAARGSGRLAVAFDIEGANAIADQLSLLQLYRDLGVRWMLLAYNNNNRVGGGCQDDDGGLTAFGREVLAEMERLRMLVCLSHTGHRTAADVLALAQRPVMFSHSNPSALQAHPRNISDELIRACAATGGVIGINGVGPFLGDNDNRSQTFARAIDHVVQLVGPGHVALGLDYVFDSAELDAYLDKMAHTFPPELGYAKGMRMVAPEQLPEVVGLLLQWGYGEADLQQVLGGNLLRLANMA
jgi:membrane dipeptidase